MAFDTIRFWMSHLELCTDIHMGSPETGAIMVFDLDYVAMYICRERHGGWLDP